MENATSVQNPSVYDRYTYSNLIDFSSSPENSSDPAKNVFYDGGGWHGYAVYPKPHVSLKGDFVGPYLHDRKEWLSKSIVSIQLLDLKPQSLIFDLSSFSAIPGQLTQIHQLGDIKISSALAFNPYDGRVAAIRYVLNNTSASSKRFTIGFSGELLNEDYMFRKIDPTTVGVFAEKSSKIYALRFINENGGEVGLEAAGQKYSMRWDEKLSIEPGANKVIYVLAIHYSGYDDPLVETDLPTEIFRSNGYEWANQLQKLPLKSSPGKERWNNVAVKALQTLRMNYREGTGDLGPIVGTIPSASINYFNGFWAWDTWKHVVALAPIDSLVAKAQLASMLSAQDRCGMIADCIFPDSKEDNWRDTKPPLAGWAAASVFAEDTTFLAGIFPSLIAYHRWWYSYRDHDKNGLCEYGSTDGTIVAARWESGMDDAVRFDSTKMLKSDWNAWSMDQESVDLNAYLYLEKKKLAELASMLGKTGLQDTLIREAEWLRERINERFFDVESGYYFDVKVGSDQFVKVKGPEGWIPLWTGVATTEIAARVKDVMTDTSTFATSVPFPTVARDEIGFMSGYWRGPVWLDQAYFAIAGLAAYGYQKEAEELGARLLTEPERLNRPMRSIRENYNPLTGEGMKVHNFSWSAAHLLMLQRGLLSGNWD